MDIPAIWRSPQTGNCGFTLVELMVTVAIMSIVMTLGIPQFNQFIVDQRVRVAISNIQGDLLFARADALNNQRRIVVESVNANDWDAGWRICVAATDTAYNCTGSPEILRVAQALGGQLKSCASQNSLAKLAFRPDGRIDLNPAFAGGGYIRISDDMGDIDAANDKIRSIYFGPSGRMNVIQENGGLHGALPC